MTAEAVEARVRAICVALPEVTERLSHGSPGFFVGKQFVMLWPDGHHDRRWSHLWCAALPGAQEDLMATAPDRFFRPPYVGVAAGSTCASTAKWTGTRSRRSARTPTAPWPKEAGPAPRRHRLPLAMADRSAATEAPGAVGCSFNAVAPGHTVARENESCLDALQSFQRCHRLVAAAVRSPGL